MKKIIPFNKDITFNTNIEEINSISLEQNIKINNTDLSGEIIISGDYKEEIDSLTCTPFIFNLPVNIDLDNKYDLNNIKIEIDNFDYEIINKDTLNVNISILLDGIEEKKDIDEVIPVIDIVDDTYEEEILDIDNKVDTKIFNSFDSDENYVTYYVHIYREKDDINSIMTKYNVSKEDLEEYNDLSNITLGSKIIIPNND